MLELIGQMLAYAGVGIGILLAGYFVLDALTPGHLGRQVIEQANPNAALLLVAAMLSLGLIEWFAIFFTGGGWNRLDDAAAFGAVGLGAQAVSFLLLDAVTPGKLGVVCTQERFHPAAAVSASMQIAVALIVCAALT